MTTPIKEMVARFGISEALLGNTAIAASVEAEKVARVAVPSRRGRLSMTSEPIIRLRQPASHLGPLSCLYE